MYEKLIADLREDAEWAAANEWETPITLADHLKQAAEVIAAIPAADVLHRDEGIKLGAELAAMHGATPEQQQLEEAYLKGVEYGMTRCDVRPVVRGEWRGIGKTGRIFVCSACDKTFPYKTRYCPNCGARTEGS